MFQQLSGAFAFWLKDLSQNILPIYYREGQKEYFGKKGMTLHVDVFFYKSKNKDIGKFTYFTAIERCDQGLVDVISISDVALEEFKQDVPSVNMVFFKSDNANCYHSNFAAERLYHLCKKHGIQLLRYDYNEPSKGKGQCDRDSATTKAYIYSGLHYASGVANACRNDRQR